MNIFCNFVSTFVNNIKDKINIRQFHLALPLLSASFALIFFLFHLEFRHTTLSYRLKQRNLAKTIKNLKLFIFLLFTRREMSYNFSCELFSSA